MEALCFMFDFYIFLSIVNKLFFFLILKYTYYSSSFIILDQELMFIYTGNVYTLNCGAFSPLKKSQSVHTSTYKNQNLNGTSLQQITCRCICETFWYLTNQCSVQTSTIFLNEYIGTCINLLLILFFNVGEFIPRV